MLFVNAVRELRKEGITVKASVLRGKHRLYMIWDEWSGIPPMYCTATAICAIAGEDQTKKKVEEDEKDHAFTENGFPLYPYC